MKEGSRIENTRTAGPNKCHIQSFFCFFLVLLFTLVYLRSIAYYAGNSNHHRYLELYLTWRYQWFTFGRNTYTLLKIANERKKKNINVTITENRVHNTTINSYLFNYNNNEKIGPMYVSFGIKVVIVCNMPIQFYFDSRIIVFCFSLSCWIFSWGPPRNFIKFVTQNQVI